MEGQLELAAQTAKLAAQLILKNGGETYRAEETARHILSAYEYGAEVIAFPTGLMLTADRQYSLISRVPRRTVNMKIIDQVNTISRGVAAHKIALIDAYDQLICLSDPKRLSLIRQALYAAGSAAMFSLMFGGGWFEFLASLLCGGIAQAVIDILPDEAGLPVSSLISGMLTAVMALTLTNIFRMGSSSLVIISAIMPFLPGLAITNAMRDAMRGDLVSGGARVSEALTRSVVIAAGVGIVVWLWLTLFGGGSV